MVRVGQHDAGPDRLQIVRPTARTEALVPTGMKVGVGAEPWAVWMVPTRIPAPGAPEACISNEKEPMAA